MAAPPNLHRIGILMLYRLHDFSVYSFQGSSFPQAMGAIGSGHLEIALDLLPLPISQAKAVFTSGLEMSVEAANSV